MASALGTLDKLDARVRPRFAAAAANLDAVDALVAEWRDAVHAGRAEQDGFGTWLNIPSKVAQVAAVRAVARERRAATSPRASSSPRSAPASSTPMPPGRGSPT